MVPCDGPGALTWSFRSPRLSPAPQGVKDSHILKLTVIFVTRCHRFPPSPHAVPTRLAILCAVDQGMTEPPYYRCPGCDTPSGLVVGPGQAFRTNEGDCRVVMFDPSLPDGGLSQATVINLAGSAGSPSPRAGRPAAHRSARARHRPARWPAAASSATGRVPLPPWRGRSGSRGPGYGSHVPGRGERRQAVDTHLLLSSSIQSCSAP